MFLWDLTETPCSCYLRSSVVLLYQDWIIHKKKGQQLLNWFVSSFPDDHYLRMALTQQDLRILGAQFCTNMLAAGVLRQIADKDAPTESLFRPDLMYLWTRSEIETSASFKPGRLPSHLTSPAIEDFSSTSQPISPFNYSQAEFQQIIASLKENYKENLGAITKEYEARLSSLRADHLTRVSELQKEIVMLKENAQSLNLQLESMKTTSAIEGLTRQLNISPTKVSPSADTTDGSILSSLLSSPTENHVSKALASRKSSDSELTKPTSIHNMPPKDLKLENSDILSPSESVSQNNVTKSHSTPSSSSNSPVVCGTPSTKASPTEQTGPVQGSPQSDLLDQSIPKPLAPSMSEMGPSLPSMRENGPPAPPMPGIEPPLPPMPELGPLPPPMPGIGPPPPPMPGMGPPGMGPPPPPMPGMGPAGMGPSPPPMPGMGPPPPPMPGMGPPPPPMPGMGPPPPPPVPGSSPMPPPIPGCGPPLPPPGPTPLPAPPVGGWNAQRAGPCAGKQAPYTPHVESSLPVLRKAPVTPAVPMKPLFWSRIIVPVVAANNTTDEDVQVTPLWEEIEEAPIDNISEFNALFSRQVITRKPTKKKTVEPTRVAVKKLLDSKRSQNVGILASSLHVDFSEIENAIYNFDTSVVSLEALHQIYEARATSEEQALMKDHVLSHPDEPLDKPEQFLLELSDIQNFAERIACFMFQTEFDDVMTGVDSKLNNIKTVCDTLTGDAVKNVIATILALGNYMNGGNMSRGQADGFGLEILPRLRDVKSTDNSVTLLHYLVRTLLRRGPAEALLPLPEPGDIARAATVDASEVANELTRLESDLEVCKRKMEAVISSSSEDNLQPFKKKMQDFLEFAEERLRGERDNLDECKLRFKKTTKFYQFRPKSEEEAVSEFFGIWAAFAKDFKDIWKKEQQRLLKEKVQEMKRKQEKMKNDVKPIKAGGLKEKMRQRFSKTPTNE